LVIDLAMPRDRDSLSVESPDFVVAALTNERPCQAANMRGIGDQSQQIASLHGR